MNSATVVKQIKVATRNIAPLIRTIRDFKMAGEDHDSRLCRLIWGVPQKDGHSTPYLLRHSFRKKWVLAFTSMVSGRSTTPICFVLDPKSQNNQFYVIKQEWIQFGTKVEPDQLKKLHKGTILVCDICEGEFFVEDIYYFGGSSVMNHRYVVRHQLAQTVMSRYLVGAADQHSGRVQRPSRWESYRFGPKAERYTLFRNENTLVHIKAKQLYYPQVLLNDNRIDSRCCGLDFVRDRQSQLKGRNEREKEWTDKDCPHIVIWERPRRKLNNLQSEQWSTVDVCGIKSLQTGPKERVLNNDLKTLLMFSKIV